MVEYNGNPPKIPEHLLSPTGSSNGPRTEQEKISRCLDNYVDMRVIRDQDGAVPLCGYGTPLGCEFQLQNNDPSNGQRSYLCLNKRPSTDLEIASNGIHELVEIETDLQE